MGGCEGDEFVSEPIAPVPGTADIGAMARGEPGLPARFTWRDTEYAVKAVIKAWKSSSCEGGTGKLYLRRHWYMIQTDPAYEMTIYCERQARNRRAPKSRWWLYSVRAGETG